jgi:prepilin-type processing-associated H-X9-DG protein
VPRRNDVNDSDLRAFAATTLGGDVVRWEHNIAGSSRQTYMVTVAYPSGGTTDAVVRHDGGSGPFSGSAFTLARESALLEALEGRGLPIPRALGLSGDGATSILECLPGTTEFVFSSSGEHAAVGREYVELVAALHALDTPSVDSDWLPRPRSAADHALCDLTQWESFVEQKALDGVTPVLLVASQWLRANAPQDVQATVVVHGDCGPGNFLHADGHVTGMLDWELAHVGDPMDDLAWWWFREDLHPVRTDLSEWYRHYSEVTSRTIDLDRIAYYRAFVLYRTSIATCADHALVHARPYMVGRLALALEELGVEDGDVAAAADPFRAVGLLPIASPF